MDGGCEQEHEFEIVRCSGHQHIGSRCITLYNAENGERICQSCPIYGTEEGEFLRRRRHSCELYAVIIAEHVLTQHRTQRWQAVLSTCR